MGPERSEEALANPLQTYLHDHLAGARFAVSLLESLRDRHGVDEVGRLAARILPEVEHDKQVLEELIRRAGGSGNLVKEATAWLGERASRLKLHFGVSGHLGTFEALETLSLGILGKRALWSALRCLAEGADQTALQAFDYDALSSRAREQYEEVENLRLQWAEKALIAPEVDQAR